MGILERNSLVHREGARRPGRQTTAPGKKEMVRRTKEEALETRNRILDAAEAVFHARGVARPSLADIAEAAGVTRGAIYWHFKNKSDVFAAMCDRVNLPVEALCAPERLAKQEDPLGSIRDICAFVFR